MQLHVQTGIIPRINTDPEQALLKLEKHQESQNGLRNFLRFSKDDKCYINLYTEENVSIMASIFSYQLLYPSGVEQNEEKHEFTVTAMCDDLDIATSWVEMICLASGEPRGDEIEVKEDVSNDLSQEELPFTANSMGSLQNKKSPKLWTFTKQGGRLSQSP